MSLRDQLLKAGLANKQQAKKAANEAKKRKHKALKSQKNATTEQDELLADEISLEIQKKKQEQQIKDRNRNLEIEAQRKKQEELSRAGELLISRHLPITGKDLHEYYFIQNEKIIKVIHVNERQAQLLSEGKIGIAGYGDDQFYLLERDDCQIIGDLRAEYILCLHDLEV